MVCAEYWWLPQANPLYVIDILYSRKLIFSKGVDFPNVKIVCTAGLPSTIVDVLQRAGRALRTSMETALFVLFYEAWALEINENEYMGDESDPDRPRKDLRLSSRRAERAPLSGIKLVQLKTCSRRFFAYYLNDTSAEGMCNSVSW
jgi:superfamily II DNA or RNA helicase